MMKLCLPLAALLLTREAAGGIIEHLGVSPGTEAHQDLSSPHLGDVSSQLTQLLQLQSLGDQAPTNNSEAATQISNLIQPFIDHLHASHNRSLEALSNGLEAFETCNNNYQAGFVIALNTSLLQLATTPVQAQSEAELLASHAQCKAWENSSQYNLSLCHSFCLTQTRLIGQDCIRVDAHCDPLQCDVRPAETYRTYLQRMVNEIAALEDLLDSDCTAEGTFCNSTHRCTDITETLERCYRACQDQIVTVDPSDGNLAACCASRVQLDQQQCRKLEQGRRGYDTYVECFAIASANYASLKAEHEAQAASRQGQMRSLLRLQCLLGVFGHPDQKTKLAQCIDARYSNSSEVLYFAITASPAPTPITGYMCEASEIPGTPEHDAKYYNHLPTGLAPCPEHSCADVCQTTNSSGPSPPIINSTTTTTTGKVILGTCYKPISSGGAVVWALGSMQIAGSVRAELSEYTDQVEVYLTNSMTNFASFHFCGVLTAVTQEVSCSSIISGGRFLALKPRLFGTCTLGSCLASFCSLHVEGVAWESSPRVGTQFAGAASA
eukprot:TRINITY_DN32377_c0_g1_i1.p1 TRINITY_DN32377_c0_g1~~TRINITY_DN32377_c0_g1_i1.p1  ORF type:complete len:551 (-),score=74.86 TRINITY_DN32377_c0_g1_i1:87-1739(-)